MSRSASSGFKAFCWEWKSNKESEGRRFKSISEVLASRECYDVWKRFPEDTKDYYRVLAKNTDYRAEAEKQEEIRQQARADRRKTWTEHRSASRNSRRYRHSPASSRSKSRHSKPPKETIQQPVRNRRFGGSAKEYMSYLIGSRKPRRSLPGLVFYLVHANYFYVREMNNGNSDYYPVEIAVAECSLEFGVQRVHHVIVKEDIVKGYRNDAVMRSKESHRIPIDVKVGRYEVETSYSKIYQDICKFMAYGIKNNELPPLFCMRSSVDHIWKPTKSIIGRLAASCGNHREHLAFLPLEELFANIYNIVERRERDELDIERAVDRFRKDPNAHRNGLGCEYHYEMGGEGELHCSLSFVKRWWYRVCEYCCKPMRLDRFPSMHEPVDAPLRRTRFSKLEMEDLLQEFGDLFTDTNCRGYRGSKRRHEGNNDNSH